MTVRAENKEAEKALTIVADKDIPYRLLRKVMVTVRSPGSATCRSRSEAGDL